MSLQATPRSSALQTRSLDTPTVAVDVIIHSNKRGTKSLLADFLIGAKLFGKINRTNNGLTKATIQGHPKLVPAALDVLKGFLHGATVVSGELYTVEEPNRLDSVIIEETESTSKGNPSSGEFAEQELDEISFGGSATTEHFKKLGEMIAQSMLIGLCALRTTASVAPPREKHISAQYKTQTFHLEVSTILSMHALIETVEKKFNLTVPVKNLYCLHNGYKVIVTDVTDLRQDFHYYVTTVNEVEKKDAVIDPKKKEFYEKLKSDQDLDDEDIQIIETALTAQKVKYKQLIGTGKLEMTDEKLKECGIKQGGLRKAILSVIKSFSNN